MSTTRDSVVVPLAPPFLDPGDLDNCFAVQAKNALRVRNLTAALTWTPDTPAAGELQLILWLANGTEVRRSGASPLALEFPGDTEQPPLPKVALFLSAQRATTSAPVEQDATLELRFEYMAPNQVEVRTESSCQL